MINFPLSKSFLFALFLCLSAANLSAQQPEMVPPPIPSVVPPEPPDPDTLPTGLHLANASHSAQDDHVRCAGREQSHTWSDNTPGVTRVWDAANRLTNISNVFSAIDYDYDDAGQMKWEGSTVNGGNGRTQITYCRYPSGEVSWMTYPNGSTVVNRNCTARGQLKDVGWQAGASSYVYLPDGKVDVQVRTNNVTTSYGYDGRGMIGSVRHSKDGHDLARRDYWRDNRDRIVAWKRGIDAYYNQMEDGRGNRYKYDPRGTTGESVVSGAKP